ncbi:Uncharacterised protein [uncultured archaeon]|nr:Uncharacterised protein [uncultured archaeon]
MINNDISFEVFLLNKCLVVFVLGLTILSFGSKAAWNELQWNKAADQVVVQYDMQNDKTTVFATDKATGALFEYSPSGWTRISSSAKMFISDGTGLYRNLPNGKVGRYNLQTGNWDNILAGDADAIYGGAGKLYYKKADGSIYVYSGIPQQWTKIFDNPERSVSGLVTAGDISKPKLYRMDVSGAVYEYVGTEEHPIGWSRMFEAGKFTAIYAGGPELFGADAGSVYRIFGKDSADSIGSAGKSAVVDVYQRGQLSNLYVLKKDGKTINNSTFQLLALSL